MEIFDMSPRDRFMASPKPQRVEVVSDPYIVATRFGYVPMVTVRGLSSSLEQSLSIASRSISTQLEELRAKNEGHLKGLRIEVSKESDDPKSKYIVKAAE